MEKHTCNFYVIEVFSNQKHFGLHWMLNAITNLTFGKLIFGYISSLCQ